MATRSGLPSPDPCLVFSRRKRFRGGTIIAVDVHEMDEHQRRLRDADGYRPASCPRCGAARLHVHDRLQRVVVGQPRVGRVDIVRYICAADDCGATWRILPAFVARHLWRTWPTVGRTIAGDPLRSIGPVPARTRRRWNARLASAALQLVHLLAHHEQEGVVAFARVAGFECTRRELVELFTAGRVLGGHGLADIAAAVHLLEPGVRLM